MDDAALAISIVAVLLSSAALFYARRQAVAVGPTAAIDLGRRAEELAAQAEAEAARRRAIVRIAWRLPEATSVPRLRVSNHGQCDATDVVVRLSRVVDEGLPPDSGLPTPSTTVRAGEAQIFPVGLTAQTAQRLELEWTWTDADGSHKQKAAIAWK